MKINKNYILALIFLAALSFNLYFSFNSDYFSDSQSYFNLRAIEHIKSTGLPLMHDTLSFSGTNIILPQLFHYIIALFFFIPFYFKIIPAILASTIVIVTYLISKEITNNETSSLITSFLSGFIPIYFIKTANNISVYSLMAPFIFLLFYFLMKIEKKPYLNLFLFFSLLLPLIGASSFLFVISLIFYAILSITEGLEMSKLKKEAVLFSFFAVLLINLILFKKAYFMNGFSTVFGNIPNQLLLTYFSSFNIFSSIYLIGVLSFFLGVVGVYFGIKEKKNSIILLLSLILSTLLLLFLKLINLEAGLLFLSVELTMISSITTYKFFFYLDKTKISKYRNWFVSLFVIFIIAFAALPCYFSVQKTNDLEIFYWMKDNIEPDSVILAPFEYGHYITGIAGKKDVIDSNFLLVKDADTRFNNAMIIYNTWSETKAMELLKEYNIDYIFIDESKPYNLNFLEDDKCFGKIKGNLYQVKC